MADAEVSLALDRCQDAVHDDTKWTEALDHLAWAVGADGCSFVSQASPQFRSRLPASSLYAQFLVDFLTEGWADQDHRARRGWPKIRSGAKVLLEHDVSTEEERETLPVYRGLYSRHDLYWWASVSFVVHKNLWALSFLRSRKRGPFTLDEGSSLSRLAPHLSRLVASRLATARTRAEDLVRVVELTAGPALVVSEDLRIVAMGQDACEVLAVTPSIACSSIDTLLKISMPALVAGLMERSGAEPVVVHRKDGRPLIIDIVPQALGHNHSFVGKHSLLLIKDFEKTVRVEPHRLRTIFGLTEAEAALGERLTAGETTQQAADSLSIAHETARTQLKAIFAKTGTGRQAALVSLLLRTAVP